MKLSAEQIDFLKKITANKDPFVGSPKYLAMDDDGELRSYVGVPPVKEDNGCWGDDWHSVPYDDYSIEETATLSFIKIGHSSPFDIAKMIRSGHVQTTEVHPLFVRVNNNELIHFYEEKQQIGEFINGDFYDDRVVLVGKQKDFFEDECHGHVIFFEKDSVSDSLLSSLARLHPKLIVFDKSLGDFLDQIEQLNRMGHAVVVAH